MKRCLQIGRKFAKKTIMMLIKKNPCLSIIYSLNIHHSIRKLILWKWFVSIQKRQTKKSKDADENMKKADEKVTFGNIQNNKYIWYHNWNWNMKIYFIRFIYSKSCKFLHTASLFLADQMSRYRPLFHLDFSSCYIIITKSAENLTWNNFAFQRKC
jgi:hypothetical protein